MDRRACASLLVLVSVLLALAGPVAGGMKAKFAGGVPIGDVAVLRRLMSTTMLEDSVAPELTVDLELHRRVLAGGNFIDHGALNPNRPACKGPCPARGGPYTGHRCNRYYQCRTKGEDAAT